MKLNCMKIELNNKKKIQIVIIMLNKKIHKIKL